MTDFIEIYDEALPAEFCHHVLEIFESHEGRQPGKTGAGVDTEKKRSSDLTLDLHQDLQPIKAQLLQHTFVCLKQYIQKYPQTIIGALSPRVLSPVSGNPVEVSLDNFEQVGMTHLDALIQQILRSGQLTIQKYQRGLGGYPHWHSEIYPQDAQCEPLHRVLFYLFYLNDVEQGGETEFYHQNIKVSPKQGRLVIAPASFTHTHRGNLPRSNDKYVIASWAMFNRAEHIYA